MIEYALILVLVEIAVIAILGGVWKNINSTFTTINNAAKGGAS